MSDFLRRVIDFGAAVGAHALVFGSPKNRLRGSLSSTDALGIATTFFRELGAHAHAQGVALCIEANPTEYGGDFITTTAEAVELCRAVDHPGSRVNADLGGMTLSGRGSCCGAPGGRAVHWVALSRQRAESQARFPRCARRSRCGCAGTRGDQLRWLGVDRDACRGVTAKRRGGRAGDSVRAACLYRVRRSASLTAGTSVSPAGHRDQLRVARSHVEHSRKRRTSVEQHVDRRIHLEVFCDFVGFGVGMTFQVQRDRSADVAGRHRRAVPQL